MTELGFKHYFVEINPAMISGEACVGGKRIPVYMVVRMVWNYDVEEAMRTWDLERPEVLVACWYAAAYNTTGIYREREPLGLVTRSRPEPWRRRWREWANENHKHLWRQDYDACPDPPSAQEGKHG